MKRGDVQYVARTDLPTGFSRRAVEQLADQVRGLLGVEPGGDLVPVIERLGGRVSPSDPQDFADGTLFVHGPRDFDIRVSRYTSWRRDRFTLAHELGHYFLHSEVGRTPTILNRGGSNPHEWEANWFAGAFLMPADQVTSLLDQGRTNEYLADHFGVSVAAIEVRRNILGR